MILDKHILTCLFFWPWSYVPDLVMYLLCMTLTSGDYLCDLCDVDGERATLSSPQNEYSRQRYLWQIWPLICFILFDLGIIWKLVMFLKLHDTDITWLPVWSVWCWRRGSQSSCQTHPTAERTITLPAAGTGGCNTLLLGTTHSTWWYDCIFLPELFYILLSIDLFSWFGGVEVTH